MKSLLLASLLLCFSIPTLAQWVTIPDPAFAAFLNFNYMTCMNGDQLNTQCPEVLSAINMTLDDSNISDLTGIEHFAGLLLLSCTGNNLGTLPQLPGSLQFLDCSHNDLVALPDLPAGLVELRCSGNLLTSLPTLPGFMIQIICDNNNLASLPELPGSLSYFDCSDNELIALPELPGSLSTLDCGDNNLIALPDLPGSLSLLWCPNNDLGSLPDLPASLSKLTCQNNQLVCLPALPMTLTNSILSYFHISNNLFTCLPNYVPAMSGPINGAWLSFPLCDLADPDNNPYGCSSFTVGVDEVSTLGLQTFPNPGNGQYQIMLNNFAGSTRLEVYDLAGVRVAEHRADGALTVLDLSAQSTGLYLLRVWNAGGSEVVKLVKQ